MTSMKKPNTEFSRPETEVRGRSKSEVQSPKSKVERRRGPEAPIRIPIFHPSTIPSSHHSTTPRIRSNAVPTLRNEFGFWELNFDGQLAVLPCEPGAAYVAWLLANRPRQPIHALELAAQISGQTCPCFGADEIFHPDQAAATLFWLRKQTELEAIVDSED